MKKVPVCDSAEEGKLLQYEAQISPWLQNI